MTTYIRFEPRFQDGVRTGYYAICRRREIVLGSIERHPHASSGGRWVGYAPMSRPGDQPVTSHSHRRGVAESLLRAAE